MSGRRSLPGELEARKRSARRLLLARIDELNTTPGCWPLTIRDIAQETGLDPRTVRRLSAAEGVAKGNNRG